MRIHHIAFRTDDVERLERFYVDIIGLSLLRRLRRAAHDGGTSVWLGIGDAILMLEHASPDEPRMRAGCMEMIAFDIEKEARVGWLRRLSEAGVAIEAQTEHTLYFRDPDGRRIGISSYRRE